MKEAVAKMKAELGDDAVILHTKKYKEGGLLGLGSKEIVEITAAIEDEKPAPKKEPVIEEPPQRSSSLMPPSVLSQYKTNGTAEGVAMAERELSSVSRANEATSSEVEDIKSNISQDDSMMSPKINQASHLEEAMKPQNNTNSEPSMPYDTNNDYEVDISSRSDLNTPKTDFTSDVQSNDHNFVQARSGELKESDIENEPDENVYTAEPVISDTQNESNNQSSDTTSQNSNVNADTSAETQQINDNQNNVSQPVQQTQSENAPMQSQPAYNQTAIPNNLPEQSSQQIPYNQNVQPQPTEIQNQSEQINSQQQTVNNSQVQPNQNAQNNQENQNVNQQQTNTPKNPAEQQQTVANDNQQQQIDMNQPMTPAQMAQAQAMMMAQFNQINQMQMAQAMQQAMAQVQAQVQAQAQEQVRQAFLQAQQSIEHEQQLKSQEKQSTINESQPQIQSQNQNQSNNRESQDQDKIKKLESEIAQMKALLAQVMGKDGKQGSLSLHEALKKQEVNENILNDMAAHSEAGGTLSDSQSREAKTTLVKFLDENVNFSEGIKLNRHGVRIAALLGTTGVGKTTTLAKIAAKFVLEQGITAALITADTYRISAVEQLRTYSDILGLPLEIVYSPDELAKAINKFRNRDLILIDTAGRSQHNEYQMKELQEFLRANQRIEKHIVLSSTTKASDAIDILDKFSICEPDKVIFTKTDETASVGLIVNLLYKQKLSLSYLTNGQSVPDDITPASSDVLADLLLRKNI